MNQIFLSGYAGDDVEMSVTNSGTTVAKFPLATNRKIKDGEQETEWHNVVLFGVSAEIARDTVRKGCLVSVAGRIKTDRWEHEDKKYNRTDIIAFNIVSQPKRESQKEEEKKELDGVPF